ncbi:hypothetical protein [Pseudorhodoferax sp. Leaf265]|jgi:hypothetical protein|uniref:hypothetical protein n=1 Tax=Pseudorhodoferax sp. Leaf265 TaxID=1736315 RepID=UPI0006FD0833|nr:hypothetical protein [Pseudorhodoferax sp. Leaf265]KQP17221.1 hypothetical protein ASF45_27320 [Pseudorhodoferax sp. Leaf265]PZQ00988.1 MAG: hypothetical protein DI583_06455 [Variovorax paradoxus]PZQ13870.1 MAG: hypothetical protein DI587_06455 [Variovorax paradoxus]
MQAQAQCTERLTIPAFEELGGLDCMSVLHSGPDRLTVQIDAEKPAIRQAAARMMAGQLYATFGETPIKLLRYTVMNQGVPGRLVFDATYRVRQLHS